MNRTLKTIFIFITLIAVSILSSCATLSYYEQSVSGQIQLLRARQDIQKLLHSSDTPSALKQRLKSISTIRDFASHTLGLPDNHSYRSYADIGRKYIVWNVFATPALSMEPVRSCFLVVGCLSYRGYFEKEDARTYMERLKNENFDVYLGGVSAYSTLGWFDDPVLNGMLDRNDFDLARLIFHELAHQQLYVRDDSEFNEAFADAVALIGLDYWLETNSSTEQRNDFKEQMLRENQFIDLVLLYKEKLEQLYQRTIPDIQKSQEKASIYVEMQLAYRQLRASWGDHGEYDAWFRQDLNNAKLAAISTYRNLVPAFLQAYKLAGNNMADFYLRIKSIGQCDASQRRQLLRSTVPLISCK
jgi:predicted aminopeptidase